MGITATRTRTADGERSTDSHNTAAEQLLVEAVDDDLAVNPLTLAEVLVAPVRDDRLDSVMAALAALDVQELPFLADTAIRLAQLRAATGLKLPDCCVLLTAQNIGASIASFDEPLKRTAEMRP